MQFCNDEKYLGTREMTRDVKDQFVKSKTVHIFNEGRSLRFLPLDFFRASKACFRLLLTIVF